MEPLAPSPEHNKKRSYVWLIIGGGVVFIVLAIIGLILLLGKKPESVQKIPTTKSSNVLTVGTYPYVQPCQPVAPDRLVELAGFSTDQTEKNLSIESSIGPFTSNDHQYDLYKIDQKNIASTCSITLAANPSSNVKDLNVSVTLGQYPTSADAKQYFDTRVETKPLPSVSNGYYRVDGLNQVVKATVLDKYFVITLTLSAQPYPTEAAAVDKLGTIIKEVTAHLYPTSGQAFDPTKTTSFVTTPMSDICRTVDLQTINAQFTEATLSRNRTFTNYSYNRWLGKTPGNAAAGYALDPRTRTECQLFFKTTAESSAQQQLDSTTSFDPYPHQLSLWSTTLVTPALAKTAFDTARAGEAASHGAQPQTVNGLGEAAFRSSYTDPADTPTAQYTVLSGNKMIGISLSKNTQEKSYTVQDMALSDTNAIAIFTTLKASLK